ncbi:hypothetical protein AB0M45_18470 [Nocardia sp. NPDC051787]|uniref:hypothetical protein n=1 Tax=Nocardia sp. NPDC051787 TaxID=3155415 RepID=UPI003425F4BF
MATGVPRPALTAELLADLHADNLTPEQCEQLRPVVARDAEALRFLRSLDEVSAELRALGRDDRIIHAMPADVTARLTRFLDELDPCEDSTPQDAAIHPVPTLSPSASSDESELPPIGSEATPVTLAEHRRRRRQVRWLAAAAAATLALAAVGGVASTLLSSESPTPTAQPTSGNDQVGDDLTATIALSALGRHTVTGSLANPAALARCVQANGLDRIVLGSTDFMFHGGNAVLILLSGPRPPTITALVVGTGCDAGDPQRRAIQDIG